MSVPQNLGDARSVRFNYKAAFLQAAIVPQIETGTTTRSTRQRQLSTKIFATGFKRSGFVSSLWRRRLR